MTAGTWLKERLVELAAAICTASVLIGGLAVGVPFLRSRIAETFLYSFCCIAAVFVRAGLDLGARSLVFATQHAVPRHIVIPALSRYPAGVVR